MRKSLKYSLVSAIFGAFIYLPLAHAKTILARDGAWQVVYQHTNKGVPECVQETFGSNMGLALAYIQGTHHLGLLVLKSSWHLPSNLQIPLVLKFKNDSLNTQASQFSHVGMAVNMPFGSYLIKHFMVDFVKDNKLDIIFPEGNEGYWSVPLHGTAVTFKTFMTCVGEQLNIMKKRNTEPYSPPSTEPFSPSHNSQPPSSNPNELPPPSNSNQV